MATVLDFSILSSLSIIFVFIAVFIAGWGISYFVNPFGFQDEAKKKIYAVLAFALAFILILSKPVLAIVTFSIPWFSVIFMIGFFLLFFARMFNPGLDSAALIGNPSVWGFLIFFAALTVLFGFGAAFGQGLLETQPGVTDADMITGTTSPTDTFVPVDDAVIVDNAPTPGAPLTATSNYGDTVVLTLFHPKILGMLFMMLLGTITILLIAR